MGSWEQVSFRLHPTTGDVPKPFSFADTDPIRWIQATFRTDGLFSARYEGDGAIHSVVGVWVPDAHPSAPGRSVYRVRPMLIDGKAMPSDPKYEGAMTRGPTGDPIAGVFVDEHGSLTFPSGIDPATGKFTDTWAFLQRAP